MKKYHIVFAVIILIVFFVFISSKPTIVHAAACPAQGDTKIFVNPTNNLCYSTSDPLYNTGFNTVGGTLSACGTGGEVRCPGSTTNLPNGNLCIVKNGAQCFAGYGTSGVNTPGCAVQGGALPACPNPLNLTIKAVDAKGIGIPNINFTITYEDSPSPTKYAPGKTTTAISDATGIAIVKNTLYSGDHFSITASSPYYTFNPTQIGNLTNIGQYEMNTTFSCGTQLENGQNNTPCTFTVTPNGTIIPNGNTASPSAAIVDDPTVDSAFNSVNQTLILLGVIGVIGLVVVGIGNGGGV